MEKIKKLETGQTPGQFNHPYISPIPGRIPIIAEDPVPGLFLELFSDETKRDDLVDYYGDIIKSIAKSAREAGFNTFITSGVTQLKEALAKAGAEVGINSIFWIDSFNYLPQDAFETYDYFKDKSQPVGFKIKDEPKYNDWGDVLYYLNNKANIPEKDVPKTWNQLTRAFRMATTLFPDRLTLFTLAAAATKGWIGSCSTYEEYLDVLQRLYKPGVWIYDFYPFLLDQNTVNQMSFNNPQTGDISDGQNVVIRYEEFYSYLDTFSKHAKKTGRPFIAYCMCEGHGNSKNGRITSFQPVPTVGMLRFEAFSALAYGAQGIAYWQYGKGEYNADQKLVFEEAPLSIEISDESSPGNNTNPDIPVDRKRIKLEYDTKLWEAVRQVNSEINRYGYIFLGSTLVKCGHINLVVQGTAPVTYPFGCITKLTTSSIGILVSWLVADDDSTNYMVLVNHDPFHSQTVRIETDSKYNCHSIMPEFIGGEIPDIPDFTAQNCNKGSSAAPGSIPASVTLQPGGYYIWKWS